MSNTTTTTAGGFLEELIDALADEGWQPNADHEAWIDYAIDDQSRPILLARLTIEDLEAQAVRVYSFAAAGGVTWEATFSGAPVNVIMTTARQATIDDS